MTKYAHKKSLKTLSEAIFQLPDEYKGIIYRIAKDGPALINEITEKTESYGSWDTNRWSAKRRIYGTQTFFGLVPCEYLIEKKPIKRKRGKEGKILCLTTKGSNSIKHMQDTAIASIDKISQETFDQMKESFEKTQSLVNMAMESSEKIGQLEFFIPLYKLANGTFVVSELYPTMIALLDKFSLESQRRGTSSSWMISRIQSLREELIKELTKIG